MQERGTWREQWRCAGLSNRSAGWLDFNAVSVENMVLDRAYRYRFAEQLGECFRLWSGLGEVCDQLLVPELSCPCHDLLEDLPAVSPVAWGKHNGYFVRVGLELNTAPSHELLGCRNHSESASRFSIFFDFQF